MLSGVEAFSIDLKRFDSAQRDTVPDHLNLNLVYPGNQLNLFHHKNAA